MKKKQVSIKGKWLRLSEETNSIDYLRKVYDFLKIADKDPMAWKWITISLHGALYGFAICACRGTSNELVVYKNKKGREKLISFWDALKFCQDPEVMGQHPLDRRPLHLQISNGQKESINWVVNILRNNFEHYTPRLWSIELHGLPKRALDILGIIEFLSINTGNTRLNLKEREKVRSIISKSRFHLKRNKLYKEYNQILSQQGISKG